MSESLTLPAASAQTRSGAAGTSPVPLERLEAQICELAGHLTAATCRFLVLVADFDARRGYKSWDLPSSAAWLAWKGQLSPGTAREHVRVARALRDLPVIRSQFAAGRLSYAKVRALTRIASPATDADLAQLAAPMTGGQLERFARAHRHARDDTPAHHDGSPAHHDSPSHAAGRPGPTGTPPGQTAHPGAGVSAETAPSPEPARADPASSADTRVPAETPPSSQVNSSPAAGLADALAHRPTRPPPPRRRFRGNAAPPPTRTPPPAPPTPTTPRARDGRTAPTAGSATPPHHRRCHLEDGPALSPATAQRIACTATISWMLHDHDGNVLDAGRRHRKPHPRAAPRRPRTRPVPVPVPLPRLPLPPHRHPPHPPLGPPRQDQLPQPHLALRSAPRHRARTGLPHHPRARRGFTFTRPDGTPVPASPALPAPSQDISALHDAAVTAATISAPGDRLDLDLAIWATFADARVARERAATRVTA